MFGKSSALKEEGTTRVAPSSTQPSLSGTGGGNAPSAAVSTGGGVGTSK
jgi:hypothetical protein